jgi:hypothetical protein
MLKEIRPLTVYKKKYPDIYEMYVQALMISTTSSKKAQENDIYWAYCFTQFCTLYLDDEESRVNLIKSPFFFKPGGDWANRCLISEMGRLLLTGWYLDSQFGTQSATEFTMDVCRFVFDRYNEIVAEGKRIDLSKLRHIVRGIRRDLDYFYFDDHQDEAKQYIENYFEKRVNTIKNSS